MAAAVTQIPIVDLEPWWGTGNDRAAVGRAITAAAREFGFFQIVGHRLPQAHIDAMVAASSQFFALPTEIKQQYTPSDPAVNRGYAARGTEALSYSIGIDAPPDLFEAFNIGEDVVDYADPFYAAHQHGCSHRTSGPTPRPIFDPLSLPTSKPHVDWR